jgi:hypothetical protein
MNQTVEQERQEQQKQIKERKAMKSKCRYYLAAVAVASLATVGAQANTVFGSIWENDSTGAGSATPANVPLTTPNITFTAPDPLAFASGSLYTIGEFLSSGNGSTVLTGAGDLGNTMVNTLFNFTGSVTVTHNQTFTAGHDDGLTLVIDGITVINDPGPTSFVNTTETYTGPTGTFAFQLVYGECCGAPANLSIDLPLQSPTVPDSGSTMAMLGGALTLVGTVARRFRK